MINPNRTGELKQMLDDRRREVSGIIEANLRRGRRREARDVRDLGEDSVVEHQGELDRSLLQMRAESVTRIDEALVRLAAGEYGSCAVCGGEIAESRLRVLPFAVRCRRCEDRREQNAERLREFASKRGKVAFVPDSVGL